MIALSRTDLGRSLDAKLRSAFPEVRFTLQFRELAPALELEHPSQVDLLRDRFAAELGFRVGARWRALDEALAADLLTSVLSFDLAYDCARAVSPLPLAKNLARQFLALFGSAPGLFTNADLTRRPFAALRKKVEHVDVFRKGLYSPRKWESFENITAENKHRFQASDHHCLWAGGRNLSRGRATSASAADPRSL
jgi:hypothetical protein